MRRKHPGFWRRGTGPELIAAFTAVLGIVMIYAILQYSAYYDADVRSQIISDAIVDGAVAYAKDDMNVAEEPFRIMAQAIFRANQDLEDTGVDLDGMSCDIAPAVDRLDKIKSDNERNYLLERGQQISGMVSVKHFKFSEPDHNDIYNVGYSGPKYMDQIATVTTTASASIPLVGALSTTSTSMSLSIAKSPYNSRASSGVLKEEFKKLEAAAYKDLLVSAGSADPGDGYAVGRGSTAYHMFLEAKKLLGDGYARDGKISIKRWVRRIPGMENLALDGYEDCFAFVDRCLARYAGEDADRNGYYAALYTRQPQFLRRHIQYTRVHTAASLWHLLHEPTGYIDILCSEVRPVYRRGQLAGYNVTYSTGRRGYFRFPEFGFEGAHIYTDMMIGPDGVLYVGNTVTLEDIYNNDYYREMYIEHPYGVVSADEWTLADLRPGDILIFTNPNWNNITCKEVEIINDADSPYDPELVKMDNASRGAYVCHFSIYLGDGEVLESTATGCVGNNEAYIAGNGPTINNARNIVWTHSTLDTNLVAEVIRFPDTTNVLSTDIQYVVDQLSDIGTITYNY